MIGPLAWLFPAPARFAKLAACLITALLAVSVNAAGTWPRLEASFQLPGLATDPFDYTVTDVKVDIAQPDCTTVTLPAFFDGGTTWRVRHTPSMPGRYSVVAVRLNGAAISASNLQPASWYVTGPPTGAGFIRVDSSNARRFVTDSGRRFFPVGENVAWDQGGHTVTGVMLKMGAAHENWARVWMDHWDGKNLDWPSYGVPLPLGQLNLSVARKWDAIVEAADQAGIHFQMTLQHHGQYSTTVDPNWNQNPYNAANGGFLVNPVQFFTNATAKALTKRKLRYAVARWGYSPAIMAWELFNEVQFTDAGRSGRWDIIGAWHDEMAAFLRSQDPYHHLITTSSALDEPIWGQTDYYQHHDYPSDLITGIRDARDVGGSSQAAPIFGGECGIDFTPHVGVSPPLWAGLMAAQSGGAMPWYWDTIDANNDYALFRAASDFVTMSGLGDQDVLTRSAPVTSGGPLGALAFSPGGGWSAALQDTFTVGNGAPNGIGSAPSYLQGDYHREMTPNGYTFLADYTEPGTFSVQILTIAASGAGLEIALDNVVQTNISFPAPGSDLSTNFITTVSVSPGEHTIRIRDPGLDWVLLGEITLDPYVPMLGAYAVGNSSFNATWLWHRTNVFNASAGGAISGKVEVAGLSPGTYSATWWDTFAGTAISNLSFSVSDSNTPAVLDTPEILRSAALYVGLPAQAAVNVPALTATVGTNSPSFNLPLILTNRGGLPLGYSLSVTGASPVVYGAIDSTEPGGPVFAWKDISGIGRDISDTFTALASPKSPKDEGIAGPIAIGFDFPFFNGSQSPGEFSQLYISPNGFIAFSPFSGDTSVNQSFPSSVAPSNCVAGFWDDLDLGSSGHVYTATDPIEGTFTVQFQNVRFKGTGSTVNCQIIFKTSGEIVLQYLSMALSNTCTVGLQNAAEDQGLTVACNQNYLQTNFAVRLSPTPWLNFSSTAGYVPKSASEAIKLGLNAGGLSAGNYNATLLVHTTDPLLPVTALPVSLAVSADLPAAPSALAVDLASWSEVDLSWTNNSGNESGFLIERKTGANGDYRLVGTAGAGTSVFSDTSVASRMTYFYRVLATNSFGVSRYSDEVCAKTPMSPIELWRLANFGSADNSGSAADTADPDGDRLVNLLEYAFGQDPKVAGAIPWSFAFTNSHLTVAFDRPHPAPEDISYLVEVTGDLSARSWDSGSNFTSQSVSVHGDGTETVVVTDLAAPPDAGTHFLRLRIIRW